MVKVNHKYAVSTDSTAALRECRELKGGDYIEVSPDSPLRAKYGWTRAMVINSIPPGDKRSRKISIRCVRTGQVAIMNIKFVMNIYYPLPKRAVTPLEHSSPVPPYMANVSRINLREYLIAVADYHALESDNDTREATWGKLLAAKSFWEEKILDQLDMAHYLYGGR